MKTFIYTYECKNNDRNGNPRHWITVFRMKRNEPVEVVPRIEVGYRSEMQAVIEELTQAKQIPQTIPKTLNKWYLEKEGICKIHCVHYGVYKY